MKGNVAATPAVVAAATAGRAAAPAAAVQLKLKVRLTKVAGETAATAAFPTAPPCLFTVDQVQKWTRPTRKLKK